MNDKLQSSGTSILMRGVHISDIFGFLFYASLERHQNILEKCESTSLSWFQKTMCLGQGYPLMTKTSSCAIELSVDIAGSQLKISKHECF